MALRLDKPTAPGGTITTAVYGAGNDAGAEVIVSATVSAWDGPKPADQRRITNANGSATAVTFPDTPQTGGVQRVTVSARRADGTGRPAGPRWSNLML